ncbi:MAG: hypothetical protein M1828_002578 [Chrysothrix sp. TS-e1954]|nr:MAG: hypothetical protein M1828_002578 [Chrysothrix sp. TS-e1954]
MSKASPNALHPGAKFEGYYSKFLLPSGAHLILIVCTIPKPRGSSTAVHRVTITYVPRGKDDVWQANLKPVELILSTRPVANETYNWSIESPDGNIKTRGYTTGMSYFINQDGIRFNASSRDRVPWSSNVESPEGSLGSLPLPLHWHVNSLASKAHYHLQLPPESNLDPADHQGKAIVHEEKNWANSFPSAHTWIQAYDEGKSSICLAGGQTLGTTAFLVGYRNKEHALQLDFRPPFATSAIGISPFMSCDLDFENRCIRLEFTNTKYKLAIQAKAPSDSFFGLDAPMEGGFLPNWMGQSTKGTVKVEVYQNSRIFPFRQWTHMCSDEFVNAGMEFGGLYYGLRGSDSWSG